MKDSKIILKNWQNGEKFSDFFDPHQTFDIHNEVAFTFGDALVSPAKAMQMGFEIDPAFKLPFGCNDRIKVARYVQDTLGIKRQGKTYDLYLKLWSQLAEGLPAGAVDDLRPRSNNDIKY